MAVYESKKVTKDGRKYFFRIKYKDIYGELHDYGSPKYKTRKEAVLEETRFRIRIDELKANVSNIVFKQAYLEYLEYKSRNVKKQTILKEEDRHEYLKTLDNYKINEITLPVYRKWRLSFEKENLATITKNKIIQLLKRVIEYSNKYYNTSDMLLKFIEPFKDINEMKKEMDFFTLDEYKQFDSVIDDFKYHVLFEMLYYLGIRQGELQALTWNDINFNKKEVKITKTLTTKIKGERYTVSSPKTKNSTRTLPIPEHILNDLIEYKNQMKQYTDFTNKWFVFGCGLPLPESTLQKRKNIYCDKAELRHIRIHDFRHSCASLLIHQGANITLVSKYLGHSNITITLNTYTHLYKNELVNIADKLNNL